MYMMHSDLRMFEVISSRQQYSKCKCTMKIYCAQSHAFLIRTLLQVVFDLKAFFSILLLIMLGFANSFFVLYCKYPDEIDWDVCFRDIFDSALFCSLCA
jgi:hypothetical protein